MIHTKASETQIYKRILQERSSIFLSACFPFFWRRDYRKTCSTVAILLLAMSGTVLAHASGVTYIVQTGDCLSGIAKAHYPDATGYYFVLQANPHVIDEDEIAVGDEILLPGLRAEQLLVAIDQRGCNAASNEAAGIHYPVTKTKSVERAFTIRRSSQAAERSVGSPNEAIRLQGRTVPTPVDQANRTVASEPRGERTRPVVAQTRRPRFAVDEEPTVLPPVLASTPVGAFAVNAIGAVAPGGQNVLVQRGDQNFYLTPAAVPVAGPPAQPTATDLDRALTAGEGASKSGVGNLIIDQSLFARQGRATGEDE